MHDHDVGVFRDPSFFVIDQETFLILCEAPTSEIANKLCEFQLNTSVMCIRGIGGFDPNKNQILLQKKLLLTRPGETSVAKQSDIENLFEIQETDIQKDDVKQSLKLKLKALTMLEDIANRFITRYTDRYSNYNESMIEEWARHAEVDFEFAKNFIEMQNDAFQFAKTKIDAYLFKITRKVANVQTEQDIIDLRIDFDKMVYNN